MSLIQAREARRKAIEEMDAEKKAAFENMKFYKFYPVQTPATPDISQVKVKLRSQLLLRFSSQVMLMVAVFLFDVVVDILSPFFLFSLLFLQIFM